MKIVGYSERGVMNALFYGIAQADDKKAFAEFLKIIGIDYHVSDVEFFMEFSLSEFGSPDLLVTFNANDQKHILFIEAKTSCGKKYELEKAFEKFKRTKERYDGYSSNLYYQLSMKYLFFENLPNSIDINGIEGLDGHTHKIGDNFVVKAICNKIKDSKVAHYIAIVPKSDIPSDAPKYVKHIFWEDLFNCPKLNPYLKDTWDINNDSTKYKSQITNNLNK
jgi:hypothetical protein